MKLRPDKTVDPELAHAREALLVVVANFRDQLEANARETAWLRGEIAAVRTELAGLPREFDKGVMRAAFDHVGDSRQQLGIAQQQAALLTDSEALLALAGDVAARDFGQLLADQTEEEGSDG